MSSKITVPSEFDDFSDELIWNESKNTLLIRNNTEDITLRLEGFDIYTFNKFKSYIENDKSDIFKLKLLNLIHNSTNVTQIGQYSNIKKVKNKFKYYCRSCDKNTLYQIQGKYRGKHAQCIYCGNHASIIINTCSNCDVKSVFIKTLQEKEYNCYNCEEKLY